MTSRILKFGDDAVRPNRVGSAATSTATLGSCFSSRLVTRANVHVGFVVEFAVELCELQETSGKLFP